LVISPDRVTCNASPFFVSLPPHRVVRRTVSARTGVFEGIGSRWTLIGGNPTRRRDTRRQLETRRRGWAREGESEGGGVTAARDGRYKFNLDEYMVTIEKPLGMWFAMTDSGAVYVEALQEKGNAERGQMVMVGDVVRQVSADKGTPLSRVIDLQSLISAIEDGKGPCTFVFERALHAPTTQRIILSHPLRSDNPGRSAAATWHHPSSWPRYSASSAMSARTLFMRGGAGRVGLVQEQGSDIYGGSSGSGGSGESKGSGEMGEALEAKGESQGEDEEQGDRTDVNESIVIEQPRGADGSDNESVDNKGDDRQEGVGGVGEAGEVDAGGEREGCGGEERKVEEGVGHEKDETKKKKKLDGGTGGEDEVKGGGTQKQGGRGVRAIGGTLWGKKKAGRRQDERGEGVGMERARREGEWVIFPFFETKAASGSESGPDSEAEGRSDDQDATGPPQGLETHVASDSQASETGGSAQAGNVVGREASLKDGAAASGVVLTEEDEPQEARPERIGVEDKGLERKGGEDEERKGEEEDGRRGEEEEERRGEGEDGAEWEQAAEAAAAFAAAMGGGWEDEGRASEGEGDERGKGEAEKQKEGKPGEGAQQSGEEAAEWRWPERGFRDASSGGAGEGDGRWWGLGVGRVDEFVQAYTRGVGDSRFEPLHSPTHTQVSEHLAFGAALLCPEDLTSAHQRLGTTAVLDLQRATEKLNWAVDVDGMNRAARDAGVMVVHHPIRHHDGHDLRRKLPVAVGILHRLLRRGLHVLVTDTDGVDRAPAVVCAYLHWVLAIPLTQSVKFVCDVRPCQPNRAALAAATWDLVAMLRHGVRHTGPATHFVQIAWNHGGREVLLVGELSGGWKNPVAATAVGGSKFVLDLRLPLGSYRYKFIVDGNWRHAADLPTEVDEWGNTNNVLHVGSMARHNHEAVRERVIERPLTDLERRMLTFASQRVAFSVSPITFTPKLRPARS
ncbi:hypothetical protein CLOM_g12924, partial [Closterium sp. NIES-68]